MTSPSNRMLRFHDHHKLSALLDYVDAPAQEVIDRTARSQAQRISDETRAELDKVLRRVENIYGSFEMMDQNISQGTGTNVEYVNDLMELEDIIKDNVKKKKYQQQVTIFVVGYENVCSTRLRLIQQVNEFFMESTVSMSSDIPEEPLDVEDSDKEDAFFESLSSQMDDSINSCHQLSERLAEINKDMVDFLAIYAQNKLSNKSKKKTGKKKMEKALEQARNEISQLSEKLLNTQEDLQEKEDRIQQLYKQMEMKNIECQKYKTAAEAMKVKLDGNDDAGTVALMKSIATMEQLQKSVMESESLREALSQKDMDIRRLQTKISELSIEVKENEEVTEAGQARMREVGDLSQQKLSHLESQLQSKNMEMAETQREMKKRFEEQIIGLQRQHKVEIENLKQGHVAHIKFIQESFISEMSSLKEQQLLKPPSPEELHGGESRDSYFDENAVTKWMSDDDEEAVYKSKSQSRASSGNLDEDVEPQVDVTMDDLPKSKTSTLKEPSRMGKEPSRSPKVSIVPEPDVIEFEDTFAIDDEEAWSSVPRHHVVGRFKQYRNLALEIRNSSERMDALRKVTDRKIQTLKGQFQEHKARWMKERDILVRAVDSSENHREVAQGFAEKAVNQMETMIATAEQQDSMSALTEPSERESVMRARVSALEIANADLVDKLERTKEIAENFESQLAEQQQRRLEMEEEEENEAKAMSETEPRKEATRSMSHKSKKVTITSAYEDRKTSVETSMTIPTVQFEKTQTLLTEHASPIDSISTASVAKLDIGLSELHSFHTVDTVTEEKEESEVSEDEQVVVLVKGQTQTKTEDTEISQLLQDENTETHQTEETSFQDMLPPERSLSFKAPRAVTLTPSRPTKVSDTHHSSAVSPRLSEARQAAVDSRQGLARSEKSAQSRAAVVYSSRQISGSFGDDMEINENADMPFPPDPSGWPVADKATAVSAASSLLRKEIPMVRHPIVQEYVHTYDYLMEFKEKLAALLQDKDLLSQASSLLDLEKMTLKEDSQIAPQVEEMGRSIVSVLDQTLTLVRQMLVSGDREYPVSSLRLSDLDSTTYAGESQRAMSRTTLQTLPVVGENPGETERLRAELIELNQKYNDLREQFDNSNKKYETQLNQNTTIMMEMQGTIANLKRELTSLNESNVTGRHTASLRDRNRTRTEVDAVQEVSPSPSHMLQASEPSIIFTRLDYERNSKSLKRAVNEARLDSESYQDALRKMEDYTRIPVQRLGFIVRKYLHQHTMRQIQENARRHKSLNAEVFQMWDNMELIEMKRHRRYEEIMDYLSQERLRLAQILVNTFESIEERCSIFLIKPVVSLKSREQLQDYYAAMLRVKENEQRQRRVAEETELRRRAMAGVHPTPEVTRTSLTREMPSHLKGSGLKEPKAAPPATYWSPTTAQNGQNYLSDSLTTINTPRLLEMDVNRILLGQNNVSVPMPGYMPIKAPPQMNVRSYISVARPSSQPKLAYMYDAKVNEKSNVSKTQTQKVPPSTPLDRGLSGTSTAKERRAISSKDLSGHQPLPPITPTPRLDTDEEEENETGRGDVIPISEKAESEQNDVEMENDGPSMVVEESEEMREDETEAEEEKREGEEETEDIPETSNADTLHLVEHEDEGTPRQMSAVMSVSVSPRTQPISSAADDEREDSFVPSSHESNE